jgi:hypothetical protein
MVVCTILGQVNSEPWQVSRTCPERGRADCLGPMFVRWGHRFRRFAPGGCCSPPPRGQVWRLQHGSGRRPLSRHCLLPVHPIYHAGGLNAKNSLAGEEEIDVPGGSVVQNKANSQGTRGREQADRCQIVRNKAKLGGHGVSGRHPVASGVVPARSGRWQTKPIQARHGLAARIVRNKASWKGLSSLRFSSVKRRCRLQTSHFTLSTSPPTFRQTPYGVTTNEIVSNKANSSLAGRIPRIDKRGIIRRIVFVRVRMSRSIR